MFRHLEVHKGIVIQLNVQDRDKNTGVLLHLEDGILLHPIITGSMILPVRNACLICHVSLLAST